MLLTSIKKGQNACRIGGGCESGDMVVPFHFNEPPYFTNYMPESCAFIVHQLKSKDAVFI
jgi:hypothetical protein